MVLSGSTPSTKQQTIEVTRAQGSGEAIRDFLERELPSEETKQAPYLTNVLLNAGARYDRYKARRNDWENYATRRDRLLRITVLAERLASNLCELDILSQDDLASRLDPKEVEALIGSLRFLGRATTNLAKEIQKDGRPRDLAEERWILELADIYENAFHKPASVWGSGNEKVTKRRGRFYHLLEVSRPTSYSRYGKLSLRQIERILRRRRKGKRPTVHQVLSDAENTVAVFKRLREIGMPGADA
jgi:hypothetical protein